MALLAISLQFTLGHKRQHIRTPGAEILETKKSIRSPQGLSPRRPWLTDNVYWPQMGLRVTPASGRSEQGRQLLKVQLTATFLQSAKFRFRNGRKVNPASGHLHILGHMPMARKSLPALRTPWCAYCKNDRRIRNNKNESFWKCRRVG